MRFTTLFSAVAIVTAIAATSASAAHLDNPNRLVDAGFEGTITTDGPPFVGLWEGFSSGDGSSDFTGAMPRNGAQQLELNVNSGGQFAGAFQDVQFNPAVAGNTWWYSGWNKLLSGNAGGPEIRIEWRDSVANVEISREANFVAPLTSDYSEFVLSGSIPAGADTARIVYATQSFGADAPQQVLVDDLNFNFVPEPTSVCLALLAGLSLVGLRRRS